MKNLYGIQRTDIHNPTRYYEVAADSDTALLQFRKYWNITAPVALELLQADAKTILEEAV